MHRQRLAAQQRARDGQRQRRQTQEAPCWRAWNEGHQERRVHDGDRVPRHELQQGAALQVQHLRIRRPGVQGWRAHQRHGFSRRHQGAPRIRDVIPAIEAAGLEPARAVLTSSRDTHVLSLWCNRFVPSGSPGSLSQSSPRGYLLFDSSIRLSFVGRSYQWMVHQAVWHLRC